MVDSDWNVCDESSQEGMRPIRINFGWDCEHVRDKEGLDYVGWEVLGV